MASRLALSALCILLLSTPAVTWASPQTMEQLFPKSMKEEALGFAKEMEGRVSDSLEAFKAALRSCLANDKVEVLCRSARAEYLARRLNFLFDKTEQYKEAIQFFGEITQSKKLSPYTRHRILAYLAENQQLIGQLKEAKKTVEELGYINHWQLIGPFDNERGTGFNTVSPPERELLLDKSYKGKSRPVRWRPIPIRDLPNGLVDLDTLFRPHNQCLAYGLTYLHAKEKTAVAIRIGSDEAMKIWVNGRLLLAHDRRRPINFDQSSVGVVLKKGWNALLIKVCDQKGSWSYRVRITDPAGSRQKTVGRASTEEIRVLARSQSNCGGPKTVALCKIEKGGRGWYDQRIKEQPNDAAAHFQRGYLSYTHQADDQGSHKDRKLFDRARAIEPQNSTYHLFYSFSAAAKAEFSVNKEENKRRQALEQALKTNPRNAQAAHRLASYYYYSLNSVHQARPFISKALNINPLYEHALYLQGTLDRAEKLGALAKRRQASLVKQLRSLTFLERRADRALSLGQLKPATRLLKTIVARKAGAWNARLSLASAYQKSGQLEEAMAQYSYLIKTDPYDLVSRQDLANLLIAKDKIKDAIAILEGSLKITPEDTAILQRVGKLKRYIGDKQGSLRMFRRSLIIKRNDPTVRRYIRYLQRDQRKPFEKDWIRPTDKIIAAAGKIPLDSGQSHRILLRNIVTKVGKDGLSSVFEQNIYRIENDSGISRFRRVSVPYYVSEQHVVIQRVRVFRKKGPTEDVPVGESYDWGAGEFGSYSSYSVSMPPLNIGDIIEVRSRKDTLRHGFFGDFFQSTENFRDIVPIDLIRIAYILPKSRPFYFRESLGCPKQSRYEQGEHKVSVYQAKNIKKLEPEPYMPWSKEVMPRIAVSSFKDWNDFARWYWALVKHQHESNKEMKTLVDKLTKDAKTDAEKIRRVYEYVVTDIRYNASWEFGIHGFKPYNATSIFARKFGDCKDKSTLINTMLRHVGIKSYPVLIFGAQWASENRGKEDISLPLISHFNHCISYVMPDGKRPGMFLDGTAQYHPYGTLPSMDYGARVVVVTPEGALIKTIRTNKPEDNGVREQSTVKVQSDGKTRVQTKILGKGDFEIVIRSQLQNEGRRKEVLERILGRRYPGAKVLSVTCSDLKDLNKAISVTMTIELKKGWQKASEGLALIPMKSWLFEAMSPKTGDLASKVKRSQDLILPNPRSLDELIVYQLPAGTTFTSIPKELSLKSKFGSYQRSYQVKGNKLIMKRRFVLKSRRIHKDHYQEFRAFTTAIEEAESERVLFKPSKTVPH
jgi:cellulose synthase operon protein C